MALRLPRRRILSAGVAARLALAVRDVFRDRGARNPFEDDEET
jgi:hypothetical protein